MKIWYLETNDFVKNDKDKEYTKLSNTKMISITFLLLVALCFNKKINLEKVPK